MSQLICCAVCLVIGLSLLIAARVLSSSARRFQTGKKRAKAVVDSIQRDHSSSWDGVCVRIPELKDENVYNCQSRKVDPADYPKGRTIDVEYALIKSLGINTVEVHLVDDPPSDPRRLARVLSIVSVIVLCGAFYLLVSGIMAVI